MSLRCSIAVVPVLFLLMVAQSAISQTGPVFPSKRIRLVTPYAPGGGTDIIARSVGQKLTETMGQLVIVDNRPGAGGMAGADLVAKSSPDGYTLLVGGPSELTVAPHLHRNLPYDPFRDFAPVTLMATVPSIVAVHPSLPAHSIRELIALAKLKPGQLTFSSSGSGGSGHLNGEMLNNMARIKMVHVPYKGTGPATIALLSGEVSVSIGNMFSLLPNVKSGRVRALAVTSDKRTVALPELPTVSETLPGYASATWFGILAPAGTPASIVNKLQEEIAKALRSPEIRSRFTGDGGDIIGSMPEGLATFMKAETMRWGKVIREAGITAE